MCTHLPYFNICIASPKHSPELQEFNGSQESYLISVHGAKQAILPPSLHLAEVKCTHSVCGNFFSDVLTISPYMLRHVVT